MIRNTLCVHIFFFLLTKTNLTHVRRVLVKYQYSTLCWYTFQLPIDTIVCIYCMTKNTK